MTDRMAAMGETGLREAYAAELESRAAKIRAGEPVHWSDAQTAAFNRALEHAAAREKAGGPWVFECALGQYPIAEIIMLSPGKFQVQVFIHGSALGDR